MRGANLLAGVETNLTVSHSGKYSMREAATFKAFPVQEGQFGYSQAAGRRGAI
jgi:hypothetical protein